MPNELHQINSVYDFLLPYHFNIMSSFRVMGHGPPHPPSPRAQAPKKARKPTQRRVAYDKEAEEPESDPEIKHKNVYLTMSQQIENTNINGGW